MFSGCMSERVIGKLWDKGYIKNYRRTQIVPFGKSFVACFLKKNPKTPHIIDYICKALNVDCPVWKDFTKVHLRMISDYLNAHLAPNSASTYIHVLSATLGIYMEERVLPVKSLQHTMKSRIVPSQHVALTEKELEKFEQYEPENDMERDIKNLFLRCCYSGARCGDAKRLNVGNIIDGKYLCYVSQKTSIMSTLPLHKDLRKYLEESIVTDYCAEQERRVIHKICKAIGMTEKVSLYVGGKRVTKEKWQLISMHSARRSFATILSVMGVPTETIKGMCGHSNSAMTSRYICADTKDPGDAAMKFFGYCNKKIV